MSNVPEKFVTDHKDEIEREAHRIYKMRLSLCISINDARENFLAACHNVWNRYENEVLHGKE